MEDRVESLRTRLEKGLRARFNDKIMVDIFGSFASGLCCNKSDADMTVLDMPAGISIGELADALRDLNFQIMSLISNAKVPVTTLFDATTKTICDVTIGNRIAVVNSQLINTYRRVDYRFTPLWFAIRQLALKHGILDGKTGHLSSYALALMLIVYLQHITQPPILPKLQKVFTSGVENLFIDGHDCSFDRNDAGHPDFGTDCKNTKPTGELLLDFLEYYGKTFDFYTQEINPIDAAIVRRCIDPLLPPPSDRTRHYYSMVIRDPFIVGRNVTGNCHPKQVKKIRNCFLNSFNALSRGDIDTAFKP
ncbi:MAG: hypothetical protein J3R72DRAFT_375706 [Linnemannia gamsii]|nr:MAG: hypothetical protein J3R72DRAFT_375706 [Linnemannia gamsii]